MEIAESAAAGTPSCDMTDNKMFVEAGKDDALSIIGLRHKIWSTTYRGIYPDHIIDDFDWAWHEEKELSRINDPAYSVYLIQKDGQNIGYLTIHQANVHVKAFCRECDAASFICYCVPENVNARAFYERMGGTLIGADLTNDEKWQNSVTYQFTLA